MVHYHIGLIHFYHHPWLSFTCVIVEPIRENRAKSSNESANVEKYLPHMRIAKANASLHIRAALPHSSMFALITFGTKPVSSQCAHGKLSIARKAEDHL